MNKNIKINFILKYKIGADGTVDISPSARFCISEA